MQCEFAVISFEKMERKNKYKFNGSNYVDEGIKVEYFDQKVTRIG